MRKYLKKVLKLKNTKFTTVAAILFILFSGFYLRQHNINTWPRTGATFDEYAWTWQGINIIQKGVPISWSPHEHYTNRELIYYQTVPFYLVSPYLEHPPVFGLVAGAYALLTGVDDMYDVSIDKIRGLALLFGISSIILVFLLALEIYGKYVAMVSALLYATVPTIVIGSRIVQNENFFIVIWLLSLLLIVKYLKTDRQYLKYIAALLGGVAILAKIPWIAGMFSLVIILIFNKKYKDAFIFSIIGLLFFLAYFVYGFSYDRELFLNLWGLQLNRYDISFASIFALWQKPYLVDRFFTDGWIYFGWFAAVLLFTKSNKHIVVISALLSYFLVFLVAIPDEPSHGWYRYPFYPFLMISSAVFIKEYFTKNWILTFLFLVIIGTSLFQLTWVTVFGFSYIVFRLCAVGWGVSLIPQYVRLPFVGTGIKVISFIWFGLFILMNIWAVMIYNEQ